MTTATPTLHKTSKPKRSIRFTDILVAVILVAVIAILAVTLLKQLSLRNEASSARQTTDKLIAAMQKQDGTAALLLGNPSFKARNSENSLHQLFTQTKYYTVGTPKVVKQTVNNGKANRVVSVYYQFNAKKPFYVRVTVIQPNDSDIWRVINFSGDQTLSKLQK